MQNYMDTIAVGDGKRLRIVYDECYETRGSYALDTEEETAQAEDEEIRALNDGSLVALGGILEVLCPHCGEWREEESLWGIVVETDGNESAEVMDCMGIEVPA